MPPRERPFSHFGARALTRNTYHLHGCCVDLVLLILASCCFSCGALNLIDLVAIRRPDAALWS